MKVAQGLDVVGPPELAIFSSTLRAFLPEIKVLKIPEAKTFEGVREGQSPWSEGL